MTLETKLIIFDVGGVVISEKGDEIRYTIAQQIGISSEKLKELSSEPLERATFGLINLIDVYTEVLKEIENEKDIKPGELLDLHLELYKHLCKQSDPQILNLVKKLKEIYKVACLTNTEPEIAAYNRKRQLFKNFEPYVYLSTEIGLIKPHSEVFQYVLDDASKKHGSEIKSSEALSIDDNQDYVDASGRFGIPSLLYNGFEQGYNQLIKDFKIHGIECD